MADVLPVPKRSLTPVWLLLVAASHLALGLEEGWADHDLSLLWLAIPFELLTLLAAGLVALRRAWARTAAVLLTSLAVVLALLLVPLYLVGLFHLPQAIAALVITARS